MDQKSSREKYWGLGAIFRIKNCNLKKTKKLKNWNKEAVE